MAVGLPEGPSYPGHSPSFFRYAAPWTTAEGQHTASKSVACFHFFFSPALLRFLILLLFLMSGNVHPNPGPIFPCSLCAENVTWRGKSVQCCTCSKWVHLRCSQLSLSKFRALGSSHSGAAPPAVTLWLPPRTPPTCIPPLWNLAHPRLQTSCPPFAHFVSPCSAPSPPSLAPGRPSTPPLLPLTLSGFFNGMLEVFDPGALNYFTFSRPILSTLSASRNPILTPLSGFLDSLLCVLIAPTPILSSDTTHASGGVVIFVRQGLSFSELSTFSLSSLDSYYDYVGINISLSNSSSLSFLNVYAPYSLLPNGW